MFVFPSVRTSFRVKIIRYGSILLLMFLKDLLVCWHTDSVYFNSVRNNLLLTLDQGRWLTKTLSTLLLTFALLLRLGNMTCKTNVFSRFCACIKYLDVIYEINCKLCTNWLLKYFIVTIKSFFYLNDWQNWLFLTIIYVTLTAFEDLSTNIII